MSLDLFALRRQQPQGIFVRPVGPLAHELRLAATPWARGYFRHEAGVHLEATVGAVEPVLTRFGREMAYDGSTVQNWQPTVRAPAGASWTVGVVHRPGLDSPTYGPLAAIGTTIVLYNHFGGLRWYDSADRIFAAGLFTAGNLYTIIATYVPSSDSKAWVNGRRVGNVTVGAASTGADPVWSFGRSGYGEQMNGGLYGTFLWPYALPDELALEWSRNPWQVFRPARRRLYIPSVAAGVAVTFEQEGFRWRYDDGDEDGATFSAAQDEPSAASIGITKRLRVLVDVTGNPGSPAVEQFELQYRRTGSPTEDWKKVQ